MAEGAGARLPLVARVCPNAEEQQREFRRQQQARLDAKGKGGRRQDPEGGGDKDKSAGKEAVNPWRNRAKAVALADQVINAGFIGFYVAFLTTITVQLVTMSHPCPCPCWVWRRYDRALINAILGCLWVLLFFGILSRCLGLWTTAKLLFAALTASNRVEVEEETFLWRVLNITGLVGCPVILGVLGVGLFYIPMDYSLLTFTWASMAFLVYDCLWRVASYFFVARFVDSFPMPPIRHPPKIPKKPVPNPPTFTKSNRPPPTPEPKKPAQASQASDPPGGDSDS